MADKFPFTFDEHTCSTQVCVCVCELTSADSSPEQNEPRHRSICDVMTDYYGHVTCTVCGLLLLCMLHWWSACWLARAAVVIDERAIDATHYYGWYHHHYHHHHHHYGDV